MALIRINPTKVLVGGDKKKAETFIGPARSQLEILKQDMSFQNLSQGVRKVWLNSNVYVECRKIFNYQECKIWVRPIVAKEVIGEDIYLYIHIVKPNIGSNKGEDIDRLILWRMRNEEKTSVGVDLSKAETEYEDFGEYTDGRKWGITSPGAVVLDVDLATNTVYTESGTDEDGNPIEVDTTLNEAAQIEMAQKYMAIIYPSNPAIASFIDVYAETGDIYSPFESAESCYSPAIYDYVEAEPEIYFNESLDVDLGGGATDSFYHVRTEVSDPGVDPTPWCDDPEAEYNSINWVDLDVNAEKYLPTTETSGDAGYYNCGDFCFSNLNFPGDSYYAWSRFPCHAEVSYTKGEHYDGRYFIDKNHASFFVTLIGNSSTNTQIRSATLDGPEQGNIFGISSASVSYSSGFNAVSTPLEKAIPFDTIVWVPDNLPDCQKSFYAWTGTRRTASITVSIAQDYTLAPDGSIDQYVHHHPADWWINFPAVSTLDSYPTDGYYHPNKARINFVELDEPDFYSAISFFQGPNTNHVPLVTYYEQNHRGKIGHGFANRFDGVPDFAWFYEQWPLDATIGVISELTTHPNSVGANFSSLPEINTFQVAIIFNLIQVESFTDTDAVGNTTYWDIHTEREADQDDADIDIKDKRDNHNREKLLSAYVSAALREIKQRPDFIEPDGTYKLLNDCGLSILTGFVYR